MERQCATETCAYSTNTILVKTMAGGKKKLST